MDALASMLPRARGLTSIELLALARDVVTDELGPRPVAAFGPAGDGPRSRDGITEGQFLRHLSGLGAGRAWDRRVSEVFDEMRRAR